MHTDCLLLYNINLTFLHLRMLEFILAWKYITKHTIVTIWLVSWCYVWMHTDCLLLYNITLLEFIPAWKYITKQQPTYNSSNLVRVLMLHLNAHRLLRWPTRATSIIISIFIQIGNFEFKLITLNSKSLLKLLNLHSEFKLVIPSSTSHSKFKFSLRNQIPNFETPFYRTT